MHRCRFFCLIVKEYISMNNTSNKALTLSWRRSLSYRNQPIDLLCYLMEWFLHEKDLRQERVKTFFTHHTLKVCFYILYSRISFLFFFFFFLIFFLSIWVFFHEFHDLQDNRVRRRLSCYILSITSVGFTDIQTLAKFQLQKAHLCA